MLRVGSVQTCRGVGPGTAQGSGTGSKLPEPSGPPFSRTLAEPGNLGVPGTAPLPRAAAVPQPAPLQRSPVGATRLDLHALPAPTAGNVEQALTGAQKTLRQPSEAARIIRRSIFHVGAEQQPGRSG